jgi:5-methylcytosine-specific restriction protein A
MPRRSAVPCRQAGCPQLVRDGSGFCVEHGKERQRRYDAGRPSPSQRGYGRRWQRLRAAFLDANPLCVDPFGVHHEPAAAMVVDHVVPRNRGGSDVWENLQALCESCHNHKSWREWNESRDNQGGL